MKRVKPKTSDLPPFDTASEAGALACVLESNGDAAGLLRQLDLEYFYDLRHRAIFGALQRLAAGGKPTDSVSLRLSLSDAGEVSNAGGDEYLNTLPDQTPSPQNFPFFLERLQELATRRAALRDATELATLARDPSVDSKALAWAAQTIAENYSKPASDLPEIIDAAAFVSSPHPAPAQVVDGILHQGSKLVLGGGSKSFKTWMLLDLGLSVGHGVPWLGFETEQGPVLYLNFEIQDYAWHARLSTVATAKGIRIKPGAIQLWNLRGKASDFRTILPRIATRAASAGFALIILDPIYKLYGASDENKASDVAALLNGLEALSVQTGAAVAFGAHFSKGNQAGKEAIDRISGSGVFARDPDSILIFTKHEVTDAFGVECILRNFAPVEPFAVRWDFPLMKRDAQLDPSDLKKKAGRTREHTPEALLEVLGRDSLTSTEWQIRAKEDTGMANGTFYTLLAQLQKQNRVTRSKINRKWIKVSAQ